MKRVLRKTLIGAFAFCFALTPFATQIYAAAEESDVATDISAADPAASIDLSAPDFESSYYSVDQSDENGATILTITSDGTYELTGSAENLSVVVAKKVTATLILNSVTIDNSDYTNADPGDGDAVVEAGIVCKKNSSVNLVLAGSSSILNNPSDSLMENGIKHAKEDAQTLTISGDGALTISATYDDAVKYNGGTVSITSGTLNIADCYGDGIQAEMIDISGGTTNITLAYANAAAGYYSAGSKSVSGYNTIWESGANTKYERVNVDTGSHKALKGGTKAKTYSYTTIAEEDAETLTAGTTYSTEASGGISISGGTVNVDTTGTGLKANRIQGNDYSATSTGVYIIGSPDDGIHSNNTLSISGGTVNVAASDDGITADTDLTITNNAAVTISTAYEGMESASIIIGTAGASEGPSVTVNANDDGINASSKTVDYTYDCSDNEDSNYLKKSVSVSNNSVSIYSGSVKVTVDGETTKSVSLGGKTISFTASGDGIDCNGTLDIEGGTVYVFGVPSGDNNPIDTDNGFTLSKKATVLAAGCNAMGEGTPSSGDGVFLTYTGTSSVTAQAAGSAEGRGNAMPSFDTNGGESGGNMGPGAGRTPGGSMDPGTGRTPGGNIGPEAGGAPGGSAAVIRAGARFEVKDGEGSTLISETLPFSASYVFFASPDLTAGSGYTVSSKENGSSEGGTSESGSSESGSSESGSSEGGTSESGSSESGSTDSGSSEGGTIEKQENPLTISTTAKTYLRKNLTKAKSFRIGVSQAEGTVHYILSAAAEKAGITVTKAGKVTILKSCAAGTYRITVTADGNETYSAASKTVKVKVAKAANTLNVKTALKTYKRTALTSAKTFQISVRQAKGKVTYTLSAAAKKAGIKVSSGGKVTVPKNCKKGTYKIAVKAAGNGSYKSGKKTVTIIIK